MGTPVRPHLSSSSKKTKASYAMLSKFSNICSIFPIQTSNSFQVPSLDFPPLQPSKSFIQASKSTSKSILVQSQSSPSTISTLPSPSYFSTSQYVKKPKTLKLLSLSQTSIMKKSLIFFLIYFLNESTSIPMILRKLVNFMSSS